MDVTRRWRSVEPSESEVLLWGTRVLFYLRFCWGCRPSCPLWPDGREIRRTGPMEMESCVSWWLSSLSICSVSTDVALRIHHVNVIFAFWQYLHGLMFNFQAAETETSSKHTHASWIHVLAGVLDCNRWEAWQLVCVLLLVLLLLCQQQHGVDWLMSAWQGEVCL